MSDTLSIDIRLCPELRKAQICKNRHVGHVKSTKLEKRSLSMTNNSFLRLLKDKKALAQMIVDNADDWVKVGDYAKEIAGQVAPGKLEGSAVKELTANWLRRLSPKPEATPCADKPKKTVKKKKATSSKADEKPAVSTKNVVDDANDEKPAENTENVDECADDETPAENTEPVAKEKVCAGKSPGSSKKASAGKKKSRTAVRVTAVENDISEPEDFYVIPNMTAGFAVLNAPER